MGIKRISKKRMQKDKGKESEGKWVLESSLEAGIHNKYM